MDEVLIHIKDWRELLRYATHERGDSWNPPLVSLETARMRALAWELTPLEYATYIALVAEYAGAPVLRPTGVKVHGSDGVPRRLPLRRAIEALRGAGWGRSGRIPGVIDSLVDAGLIVLATVDGRSVDRPVLVMVKGGVGHGHGQESNPQVLEDHYATTRKTMSGDGEH